MKKWPQTSPAPTKMKPKTKIPEYQLEVSSDQIVHQLLKICTFSETFHWTWNSRTFSATDLRLSRYLDTCWTSFLDTNRNHQGVFVILCPLYYEYIVSHGVDTFWVQCITILVRKHTHNYPNIYIFILTIIPIFTYLHITNVLA